MWACKQGGPQGPLLSRLCHGHQLCKRKKEWEAPKVTEKVKQQLIRDIFEAMAAVGSVSRGKVTTSSLSQNSLELQCFGKESQDLW